MAFETILSENLANAFTTGDWVKEGDHDIVTYPVLANYMYVNTAPQLVFEGASLFFWTDGGPLSDRTVWMRKTYTGLPPSTQIGVRIQSNWLLRLNLFVFMELIGASTSHITLTDTAYSFWTLPDTLVVDKKDRIAYMTTTPAGELTVKLGIEQAFRTNNLHLIFTSPLELVVFKAQTVIGQIVKLKKLLTAG